MMRLFTLAALAITMATPTYAAAASPAPFATAAVSDDVLASARGGASPYGVLTRNALATLDDAHSRADFRLLGSVGNLQMDVWWGTIGSELIANAVRDGADGRF